VHEPPQDRARGRPPVAGAGGAGESSAAQSDLRREPVAAAGGRAGQSDLQRGQRGDPQSDLQRESERLSAQYGDVVQGQLAANRGDAGFYLELAREGQGPVLEIGCGAGRVLLEIARAGFPCSGVEPAASRLAVLRSKPYPPSLRLACAPLHAFELGADRFMLIYSAFGSMQQLLGTREQLECLACVRRHLAPGGTFAFDVPNPLPALGSALATQAEAEREAARFVHAGEPVVCYRAVTYEFAAQRMRVQLRYERAAPELPHGSLTAAFDLRYYFRFELQHLLARAGFTECDIYGDFQRSALAADNGFVIVART